jgi:hypothetical protein
MSAQWTLKPIGMEPAIVDNLYREQYWLAYPVSMPNGTLYAACTYAGSWREDLPSAHFLIENCSQESLAIKSPSMYRIGGMLVVIGF